MSAGEIVLSSTTIIPPCRRHTAPHGFDLFAPAHGRQALRQNCYAMPVTIDLQNLGDVQLCREIIAGIEHALSEKHGEWRVSIAGSRASENWEMRVEGPNGFERTYTFSGAVGEHTPEAIRRLIFQLAPTGFSRPAVFFAARSNTNEPRSRSTIKPENRKCVGGQMLNHHLDEHILRALNKIKRPSTAEEITELLNRDLGPGDRPFQTKELAIWLRNTGDKILSLYWLENRPRR